jgi:phosphatidylserine decarboxylase
MSKTQKKSNPFVLGLNILSRMTGALAQSSWSRPVDQFLIRNFAKMYNIAIDEAEKPLSAYDSLDSFFTRRLKPELRPIGQVPVHPCDGKLNSIEDVDQGRILQVKGIDYSVSELVGGEHESRDFNSSTALTYFLSPTDCHRVFSPVDGEVLLCRHIPGALWPVNKWGVKNISGLFSTNERVVFEIKSSNFGKVFVVMVGALNVGQIEVAFDSSVYTNQPEKNEVTEYIYEPGHSINAGDELGIFHLGSSVVLIFQENNALKFSNVSGRVVKYGATID